jgi:hypothetical protein
MAATIVKSTAGAATVAFGTAITLTNAIVQSTSHAKTADKATVKDGDGDTVAVAYSNFSETLDVSGIANGAITATLGASLTLTGAPTGTWLTDEVSLERTNEGFESFSIKCSRYPSTES